MNGYYQPALPWVVDPYRLLRWECDPEACTSAAGGDHAPTCVDTDEETES